MEYKYSVEYIQKDINDGSHFTLAINKHNAEIQKVDVVSAVVVSKEPLRQECLDHLSNRFIIKEIGHAIKS